ncbi:hypothetical protein I6E24_12265 [Bacteroides caecigallinarum]|nr:hypothetical protein [Bacteroides caecigallinarum]MCF2582737.1 hypothetical protein [Bacteroides caecigallinarum]
MTWIVLQFVFLLLPVFLPMVLYRSRRPFMAAFYRVMTGNAKARKLYTQVLVVLLLLFHYVYTTRHPGQFGPVLSTIVSAMLLSSRRTERWLRKLLDRPRAFVFCGIMALTICAVPQLFTLSVTISYILLAALFYPSGKILSEWEDKDRRFYLSEHPDAMSDCYHCNHHARLQC